MSWVAEERVGTLVIGAGISGLAFAQVLGRDADVLVLDSASEVGGWLSTRRVEEAPGARFELGAETVQDTSGEVASLCAECGIEILRAPAHASRRYLAHDGTLVALPHSPGGLLTTKLLSISGKLRALSEPFRDSARALDGSVADFMRQCFGAEVLHAFADPFLSGVHAGDPEQISLRAAFPRLAAHVEEHGSVLRGLARGKRSGGFLFKPAGGMQRLPEGLAKTLGTRLCLRASVRELRRDGQDFVAATDTATFRARRVVVATDRARAAVLLSGVAPLAAEELGRMRAESLVSVVHGWPRASVRHPLDGFGFLVPSREKLATLGTLFSSSLDPACASAGQVILRTLLGGARRPDLVQHDDATLIQRVLDENSKLLGFVGAPSWTRVVRYCDAIPRYDLDHPRRVAAIEADVARVPGLHVLGNALRGLGVSSLVARARAGREWITA